MVMSEKKTHVCVKVLLVHSVYIHNNKEIAMLLVNSTYP